MHVEFVRDNNQKYLSDIEELMQDKYNSRLNSFVQLSDITSKYILVVIDKRRVVGFVAFAKNYSNQYISKKTHKNLMVTSMFVEYLNKEKEIMCGLLSGLKDRYPGYNIFINTLLCNSDTMEYLMENGFEEYHISTETSESYEYYLYQPPIKLIKANQDTAETMWQLQVKGFQPLLDKYQDHNTNPACESLEKVKAKIAKPSSNYYFILVDGEVIGGINVGDHRDGSPKKIAPLFILPEFQNKGYAQRVIKEVEKIHGKKNWFLATIKQEPGNCHLYEKMGYHLTGKEEVVNDRMTIVIYEK